MRTVTQNIKVELENDERLALRTAMHILQNFMDIMKDHECYNVYFEFEQFGIEYDKSNLEEAIDLLGAFNEDDPTID